jgi:hypothetical protein
MATSRKVRPRIINTLAGLRTQEDPKRLVWPHSAAYGPTPPTTAPPDPEDFPIVANTPVRPTDSAPPPRQTSTRSAILGHLLLPQCYKGEGERVIIAHSRNPTAVRSQPRLQSDCFRCRKLCCVTEQNSSELEPLISFSGRYLIFQTLVHAADRLYRKPPFSRMASTIRMALGKLWAILSHVSSMDRTW